MTVSLRNVGYSAVQVGVMAVSGLAIGAGLGVLSSTILVSAIATSILFSGTLALWYSLRAAGETLKIPEGRVALITGFSLAAPIAAAWYLWPLSETVFAATATASAVISSPLIIGLAISAWIISVIAYIAFSGFLGTFALGSIGVGLYKRNDPMVMENALLTKLTFKVGIEYVPFWNLSTPESRTLDTERKRKLDEGSKALDVYAKSVKELTEAVEDFRRFLEREIEEKIKSNMITEFGKGRSPTENCFILLIDCMTDARKQLIDRKFYTEEEISSHDHNIILAIYHLGIANLLDKIDIFSEDCIILKKDSNSIAFTREFDEVDILTALSNLKKTDLSTNKEKMIREVCYKVSPPPTKLLDESIMIMNLGIKLTKMCQKYKFLNWKGPFL